jgi:murein DD-endopeptidase MepM/ murein hydrolase activator NlpD
MSFVMIATGPTSRSRVRTLSMPQLLVGIAFAGSLLLGAGAVLGYWIGSPVANPVARQERPHAALPFTLEQLGSLSARIFRLENEALQLGRRIGVLQKDPKAGEKAPGSGGPMLPPRSIAGDIESFDAQLARIESQIGRVSDATAQRNIDVMRMPTRWPIAGADLSSPFGNRQDPFSQRHAFHAGLDFAAEYGTPIRSAAGGTVTFAGYRSDYGFMVEIAHGNGLATRYAHASRLLVKPGVVVVPGERIADVGSTGRSTGAHLHFEVLREGAHVDPKRYLAGL